jgi:hypothetical protein
MAKRGRIMNKGEALKASRSIRADGIGEDKDEDKHS